MLARQYKFYGRGDQDPTSSYSLAFQGTSWRSTTRRMEGQNEPMFQSIQLDYSRIKTVDEERNDVDSETL